jgi:hypothetical protein
MIRQVHTLSLLLLLLSPLPTWVAMAQTPQPKPANWTALLNKLFGRQPRPGSSKDTSPTGPGVAKATSLICPMSPTSVLDPKNSSFSPRIRPGFTADLQPTIAWQGYAGGVKIEDMKTKETWTKLTPKSTPAMNQVKYDGKPLTPDREYSLLFLSMRDGRTSVVRHRFKTLPADEIATVTNTLKTIETEKKSPDAIAFEKVLYLSGLDLIGDAHSLILSMPEVSPELKTAMVAYTDHCKKEVTPDPEKEKSKL